jgi:uncharacterized repeat protein (TIGR01451 family)
MTYAFALGGASSCGRTSLVEREIRVIRRTIAAGAATSVAAALLVPWGTAATAADLDPGTLKPEKATAGTSLSKGPVLDLASGKGDHTYIVQLEDPAVPSAGLQRSEEKGYASELRSEQADLTASISRITGTSTKPLRTYTHALNGVAVKLTRQEALAVSRLSGVVSVTKDFTRQLTTDKGPEWIGAPTVWDGSNVPDGVGSKGEGIVVGILDSGLNPANPSFADVGGDGYDHTNPLGAGKYKGVCDSANPKYIAGWGCNDKVIGYWDFDVSNNDDGNYDDDGHGSHTASTTAGNEVEATVYAAKDTPNEFSVTSTIKGVAPHANIIGYDVCDGACQGTSIVSAIEQAIKDEVDVINYSIGSASPSNPWANLDAIGFLNARAAGIHVATSAGNTGPGAATLGSPGDVPWMTTVGATTHDRKYVASVTDLASDAGAGPNDIAGAGLSGPTDAAYPLVYAGDAPYNNPTCFTEYDETTGNPLWTPDLTGKIVVCDRGGNGRVEKGEILAFNNAEGMVLANDQASGGSLNGDAHALPAAHITYADGVALKQWMGSVTGEEAALSGSVADIKDANGDIMAAFSSRGPNRAVSMISPSVSAPGVDILAAYGADNEVVWEFVSGTSMASPHTAGALALIEDVQPGWTPAEAQSALMTTAFTGVTDSDGTAADWHDMGSGRIDLTKAAKAGVVLDEDKDGYLASDPGQGGDVRQLNTASIADNDCLLECSWTRTFTGTATGVGTWGVSVTSASDDLTLTTDKASIAVTDGGDVSVSVTAEVAGDASTDEWLYGTLVLTPPAGSTAPEAHLPVGVLPSSGVLPDSVDITTRRDAGSQPETDLRAIPVSDLQLDPSGLVPGTRKALTIPLDTTNRDAFDGNGVQVESLTVGEGVKRLVAKLENPTAPDFDLFVGRGAVSAANVVCQSASGGSAESCDIADPEAGTWWVLVQNWEAAPDGDNVDTTDLVTAVVGGDAGNMRATGPEGPIVGGEAFDIRVFWDEPELDAGETWYGALSVGTDAANAGNIGVMPVTLDRIADDVTKSTDVERAAPGDVITYTVDVSPNVGREDMSYTITDPLPAGTSYVEGSATDGATYSDGNIAWTGTLEAPSLADEAYAVTSSKTDASCVNPFTGNASYFDLKSRVGLDPNPAITGDGATFTTATAFQYGLYEQYGAGLTFTDDGFLLFGGAGNYGTSPGVTQSVPDAALPNNVAAALWQDMVFTYEPATAGVTIAGTADGARIIEYDNMRKKGDPSGAQGMYDFEVIAFPNSNDYVFVYDNITGPLTGVTIGAENADGSGGDALVNKGDATGVITDDTVVCLTAKPKDVDGASFTYQVKVDAGVADGPLTNKLVHTVDNPGAKPASASHTLMIDGVATSEVALTVSPDRIDTGGTTTATANVFSSKAAPATGTVQFWAGDRLAGTGTLDATGKATAALSGFATSGTFPVTAKYLGDASNAPATSAPVNLVVGDVVKVKSRIDVDAPKVIKQGKKAKLKIAVSAPNVVPTGTVEVTVKGALKKKTWTLTLNEYGKARLTLPKATKVGKIKVKVEYLGDAAVLGSKERLKIRVVKD